VSGPESKTFQSRANIRKEFLARRRFSCTLLVCWSVVALFVHQRYSQFIVRSMKLVNELEQEPDFLQMDPTQTIPHYELPPSTALARLSEEQPNLAGVGR